MTYRRAGMTYGGAGMTEREETGLMNQAPTLGKIKKDIDSHFHGNDRKEKQEGQNVF